MAHIALLLPSGALGEAMRRDPLARLAARLVRRGARRLDRGPRLGRVAAVPLALTVTSLAASRPRPPGAGPYACRVSTSPAVEVRPPLFERLRDRWAWTAVVANLVGQIVIIVTGGAVRLTGSGLGCSSWPQCEPGEFTPVLHAQSSFHPYVEFGNRMVAPVLRRDRPRRRACWS